MKLCAQRLPWLFCQVRQVTSQADGMQGLAHMQESAQRWEAQAQENLQHMDQLKSLLEESAFWQSQSAQLSTADADGSNSDHQRAPDGKHCCKVVSHLTRTTLKTCVAARQLPPLTDQLMCTSMLPLPPPHCVVSLYQSFCVCRGAIAKGGAAREGACNWA